MLKITIQCTYANGDKITTSFNGTLAEAGKYYTKKLINVGASVMCDVEEFVEDETEITPQRILEELEWKLYQINADGWYSHLENPQQIRSLKSLIKNVKNITESQK